MQRVTQIEILMKATNFSILDTCIQGFPKRCVLAGNILFSLHERSVWLSFQVFTNSSAHKFVGKILKKFFVENYLRVK